MTDEARWGDVRPVRMNLDTPDLHVDGPWIRAADLPAESSTLVPSVRWHDEIQRIVTAQEPWALIGQNRMGDAVLFDTSPESLFRCAGWAVAVRCVFPAGRQWDKYA